MQFRTETTRDPPLKTDTPEILWIPGSLCSTLRVSSLSTTIRAADAGKSLFQVFAFEKNTNRFADDDPEKPKPLLPTEKRVT